jgi:hypothetical protein
VCGEITNPSQNSGVVNNQTFTNSVKKSINHNNANPDEENNIELEHRLLNEMDTDLAEAIYKGHYLQTHGRGRVFADKPYSKRSEEVKFYSNAIESLLDKLATAKESISDMNKQRDLVLKRDLIDMELRLLEAEVGTLLSRGSALTLMLQHANEDQTLCRDVEERSNILKDSWSEVKRLAEFEKAKVLNTKDLVNFYRKTFNDLQDWINRNEDITKVELERKVGNKRKVFHNVECLADRLRKDGAFNDCEKSYAKIVKKWEGIERKIDNYKPHASKGNHHEESPTKTSSNSNQPSNFACEDEVNVNSEPTSPSKKLSSSINLATRIEKLRNAIKAINRQLGTQILSGKELENLTLQKETLETVKEALDKLKTLVITAEKDIESLFSSHGSMSIEFLEKLTGLNEKLQEEWKWVNNRYIERQSLWNKSDEIMENFDKVQSQLLIYLKNKSLYQHPEQVDNNIETARTKIAHHVMDCQEIKSKLSTQEASKGKLLETNSFLFRDTRS